MNTLKIYCLKIFKCVGPGEIQCKEAIGKEEYRIQGDRRQESGDRITYIPFIGANGR